MLISRLLDCESFLRCATKSFSMQSIAAVTKRSLDSKWLIVARETVVLVHRIRRAHTVADLLAPRRQHLA